MSREGRARGGLGVHLRLQESHTFGSETGSVGEHPLVCSVMLSSSSIVKEERRRPDLCRAQARGSLNRDAVVWCPAVTGARRPGYVA